LLPTWSESVTNSTPPARHDARVRFHAPPLSNELLSALDSADNGRLAIAEINRQVGATAIRLGKVRPSYELVRQAVHERRQQQSDTALLQVALDVAFRVRPPEAIADYLAGTLPDLRPRGGK
jgi:hypothetical protein